MDSEKAIKIMTSVAGVVVAATGFVKAVKSLVDTCKEKNEVKPEIKQLPAKLKNKLNDYVL